MTKINNNKAGFSLVELMVVVAIIGILASIAVPNFLKFQAKAKQSNAKTELAAMYSSQKTHFAETNSYHPNFPAIGFAPDGVPFVAATNCPNTAVVWPIRFYSTGFGIASASNTNANINGTPAPCGAASGNAVNGVTFFSMSTGAAATGAGTVPFSDAVGAVPAGAQALTTFLAFASGRVGSAGGPNDVWSINEVKALSNVVNGI